MNSHNQKWFLRLKAQNAAYGPYTQEQMISFYQQEKLTPDHVISNDGKSWLEVAQGISLIQNDSKDFGHYKSEKL